MVQMAMAVKPLLGIIPPKPTSWNPKELFGLAAVGNHFRHLGEKLFYDLDEAHDHELGGLFRRMV